MLIHAGDVKFHKMKHLICVSIVVFVLIVKLRKVSVKNSCGKCPTCSCAQSEIRGLREVVRSQGQFILKIKKMIADYSGESKNWDKFRY